MGKNNIGGNRFIFKAMNEKTNELSEQKRLPRIFLHATTSDPLLSFMINPDPYDLRAAPL